MEFRDRPDWVVTSPALKLRGIQKRFGEVVALEDASFSVREGRIHALLNELLDTVDRVVVIFAGRALGVPANRDAVGRAMLGA